MELSGISNQLSQSTLGAEAEREITASDVTRYFKRKRNTILLCLCILQLIVFGLLAWWVHTRPFWFIDVLVTHEFQDHQALWLHNSMIAVSYLGNVPLLFRALVLLTALIFFAVRLRLEAIMLVAIFEISRYLNNLLKEMIDRPRPSTTRVMVMEAAGGTSFPSGHVMSYVAFWGFLLLLALFAFKGKRWWRIALVIVSALFVASVGPSRIYLGDHWATDVAGAYLFEGALLCLAFLLYFKLKQMSPRFKAIGIGVVKRLRSELLESRAKRW
jgi:undecaprenyl-diphosphatase